MTAKRYKNYMEQVVEKALAEFVNNDKTICGCENCLADIAAAALNRLKPCYITSKEGLLHAGRRERDVGFASGVVHAVKAASELVMRHPRHDAESRAARKPYETPSPETRAVTQSSTEKQPRGSVSRSGARPKTTARNWPAKS